MALLTIEPARFVAKATPEYPNGHWLVSASLDHGQKFEKRFEPSYPFAEMEKAVVQVAQMSSKTKQIEV